jgi:hypothetical protein
VEISGGSEGLVGNIGNFRAFWVEIGGIVEMAEGLRAEIGTSELEVQEGTGCGDVAGFGQGWTAFGRCLAGSGRLVAGSGLFWPGFWPVGKLLVLNVGRFWPFFLR